MMVVISVKVVPCTAMARMAATALEISRVGMAGFFITAMAMTITGGRRTTGFKLNTDSSVFMVIWMSSLFTLWAVYCIPSTA